MMGSSPDAMEVQIARRVERVMAELEKDRDELTEGLARNRTDAIIQGLSNLDGAAEALRPVREALEKS